MDGINCQDFINQADSELANIPMEHLMFMFQLSSPKHIEHLALSNKLTFTCKLVDQSDVLFISNLNDKIYLSDINNYFRGIGFDYLYQIKNSYEFFRYSVSKYLRLIDIFSKLDIIMDEVSFNKKDVRFIINWDNLNTVDDSIKIRYSDIFSIISDVIYYKHTNYVTHIESYLGLNGKNNLHLFSEDIKKLCILLLEKTQ